jgi:iron(III) transport system ATP-binding protein
MADVSLRGVRREAGGRAIVDDLSLEIAHGECLALLGPSGCGKTTLLRLLAGFETLHAGEIMFDGKIVAAPERQLAPEERRVGMVFQSYALWPHLDVARNVGYALKVQKLPKPEREKRVAEALETVGLPGFDKRRVQSLSGGQRQRVALARCLAMRPRLVLLDEPLANLDAHLRETMIDEFRRFHAASGATLIYVTHDQAEAMALADRIAVMDNGRLRQVDTPDRLYQEPCDAMVARFLGQGQLAPVTVLGPVENGWVDVELFGHRTRMRARPDCAPGPAQACLRPGDLVFAEEGGASMPVTIVSTRFEGGSTLVRVAPEAAPETTLNLRVGGRAPMIGERRSLAISDGWLLPVASPG